MDNNEEQLSRLLVDFLTKGDRLMRISLDIFIRFWLSDMDRNTRILDCGCGIGHLINRLSKRGFCNLTGVEVSSEMARIAAVFTRCNIVNADVMRIGEVFPPHSFNVIIFSDILHHIPEKSKWRELFEQCRLLLKENGHIIIREPHPTPLLRLLFAVSRTGLLRFGPLKSRLEGLRLERDMQFYFFANWVPSCREMLAGLGYTIESQFTGPVRSIMRISV